MMEEEVVENIIERHVESDPSTVSDEDYSPRGASKTKLSKSKTKKRKDLQDFNAVAFGGVKKIEHPCLSSAGPTMPLEPHLPTPSKSSLFNRVQEARDAYLSLGDVDPQLVPVASVLHIEFLSPLVPTNPDPNSQSSSPGGRDEATVHPRALPMVLAELESGTVYFALEDSRSGKRVAMTCPVRCGDLDGYCLGVMHSPEPNGPDNDFAAEPKLADIRILFCRFAVKGKEQSVILRRIQDIHVEGPVMPICHPDIPRLFSLLSDWVDVHLDRPRLKVLRLNIRSKPDTRHPHRGNTSETRKRHAARVNSFQSSAIRLVAKNMSLFKTDQDSQLDHSESPPPLDSLPQSHSDPESPSQGNLTNDSPQQQSSYIPPRWSLSTEMLSSSKLRPEIPHSSIKTAPVINRNSIDSGNGSCIGENRDCKSKVSSNLPQSNTVLNQPPSAKKGFRPVHSSSESVSLQRKPYASKYVCHAKNSSTESSLSTDQLPPVVPPTLKSNGLSDNAININDNTRPLMAPPGSMALCMLPQNAPIAPPVFFPPSSQMPSPMLPPPFLPPAVDPSMLRMYFGSMNSNVPTDPSSRGSQQWPLPSFHHPGFPLLFPQMIPQGPMLTNSQVQANVNARPSTPSSQNFNVNLHPTPLPPHLILQMPPNQSFFLNNPVQHSPFLNFPTANMNHLYAGDRLGGFTYPAPGSAFFGSQSATLPERNNNVADNPNSGQNRVLAASLQPPPFYLTSSSGLPFVSLPTTSSTKPMSNSPPHTAG